MIIEAVAISDKGKVRKNNEDMALMGPVFLRDGNYEAHYRLEKPLAFAVADGIGGSEGGEIASELVIKSLFDLVQGLQDDLKAEKIPEILKDWAEAVNRLVIMRADKLGNPGMGTTLTGLLFYHDSVFLFNAGDSRLYRLRDDFLRQLTKDQTLRELSGNKDFPGNIMYNAFGKIDDFFIDVNDITGQIRENDIFLLCTDGLSDMISNDEIESCLKDGSAPSLLIESAITAGGKDNITFIIIKPERGLGI